MKFCPVCKTSYDEEILRFCTKDGTPLVESATPNFTALPSSDDLNEQTVIRRKTPAPIPSTAQPIPDFDDEPARVSSPRIVIPMTGSETEPPPPRENVRAMTTESVRRQPPKSNTALTVFLTILGTVVILAGGIGIYSFLNNQNSGANQNANYNANFNSIDINLNSNLSVGNSLANFNYNANANANANANVNANANSNVNANANLKSPTPTRTPTASPSPSQEGNVNGATNVNSGAPSPSVRPSFNASPRPSPSAAPAGNRPVNAGILNGRAVNLPKPAYPQTAKQMNAGGQVSVQVMVDETGNVTAAKATSGNVLLRSSAEAAARQSKFNPVRVNNQAVPATGTVIYNFVN